MVGNQEIVERKAPIRTYAGTASRAAVAAGSLTLNTEYSAKHEVSPLDASTKRPLLACSSLEAQGVGNSSKRGTSQMALSCGEQAQGGCALWVQHACKNATPKVGPEGMVHHLGPTAGTGFH